MKRETIPMADDWREEWQRGLHALATHADLPLATVERLRDAFAAVNRDLALRELAVLLDPDAQRSKWALAGEIADRLQSFERTTWPRIRYGSREPADRIDRALSAMLRCASCPRSQRRLVDIL